MEHMPQGEVSPLIIKIHDLIGSAAQEHGLLKSTHLLLEQILFFSSTYLKIISAKILFLSSKPLIHLFQLLKPIISLKLHHTKISS